jgi:hypothetical protein
MVEPFVRKDHFLEAIRNLSGYPPGQRHVRGM